MLIIIFIILLLYLVLIGALTFGFDKVDDFELKDLEAKTKFSIVIPFRNEAKQLPALLRSLSNLNYPQSFFEIILIDDDSEDDSVQIIESELNTTTLDVTILKNNPDKQSPKKEAITKAIQKAKYQWILTTDADCILPKYWLDSFDCFIQKNNGSLIVGPVAYTKSDTFLKRFQLLEFLSLQATTIGGFGLGIPFLCNGANLCYHKNLFYELKGFEGNTHISSGDDIFLLQKAVQNNKNEVQFLKNEHAVVYTIPLSNFKDLVSQRIRWAAKTSNYNSVFGKMTGIIVFSMNGLLICLPLFYIAQLISAKALTLILLIKFSIDFLLLFKSARFFNQEEYLKSYIQSSFLYPFFSVYVAISSVFKGYKWKDRAYKK
ncbi:glycosyltransferase [Psychroserpens sp. XS_ASV72]|uniref:glycosyltransferase family 2 protein n=1 Tax=Psychroserpens sp. XS_ASV72 TaxID=3241293 RepID=UPI0035141265